MISGTIKKTYSYGVALVYMILFVTPVAGQSKETLAKSYYLTAKDYYDQGKYDKAVESLDKTLEYLGSTNPKVEALYVHIYYQKKDFIATNEHLKTYFELADEGQEDYMDILKYAAEVKEKVEAIQKEKQKFENVISSVVKGKYSDPRDGQVYPIITIKDPDNANEITIMASDLNYEMEGSTLYSPTIDKYKYGRLYEWKAAVKACPPGWHLPSDNEWNRLIELIGGKSNAGKILKSKNDWTTYNDYQVKKGTNKIGFNAIGGGSKENFSLNFNKSAEDINGQYLNQMATYWSSDRKLKGTQGDRYYHASKWKLYSYRDEIFNQMITPIESFYYSCRCFKDN